MSPLSKPVRWFTRNPGLPIMAVLFIPLAAMASHPKQSKGCEIDLFDSYDQCVANCEYTDDHGTKITNFKCLNDCWDRHVLDEELKECDILEPGLQVWPYPPFP